MIESGDYVDIRFQDEVRYKKPVGIYWLQAGVVKVARSARHAAGAHHDLALSHSLAARRDRRGAADLLGGARLRVAPRRAIWPAVMMATSILLGVEARLAKTDAMLLLVLRRRHGRDGARLSDAIDRRATFRWGHALRSSGPRLAAGILLKGPLILMVVGLAAVALAVADRSARWLMRLRPLVGVLWVLLLVLPWFVAIMARAGDSFLQESVGQDLLAKVFKGQETHGAPPGYYLAAVLADVLAGGAARRGRGARGLAAAPRAGACASCWPGSCRAGSCSNWSSPSCRTTCCRSIRRSRS